MPTYVKNLLKNTILFQGGYFEIPPGTWRKASKHQIDTGVFDDAEHRKQVMLLESDEIPADDPVSTAPAVLLETNPYGIAGGMTEAELLADKGVVPVEVEVDKKTSETMPELASEPTKEDKPAVPPVKEKKPVAKAEKKADVPAAPAAE